jgi:predicted NAD/FAD-dependent oxidoreductase
MSTRRAETWRADLGIQFVEGKVRYHPDGMSAFAKAVAGAESTDSRILLRTRVTQITETEGRWNLVFEAGGSVTAAAVVLTAPLPQSVELLEGAGLLQGNPHAPRLRSVQYTSAFAMAVAIGGNPPPRFDVREPFSEISDRHS